jgi:Transcriptional regulator, AbiEi antitoxin, Type IV TA system
MLKNLQIAQLSANELELHAAQQLRELLLATPLEIENEEHRKLAPKDEIDFTVQLRAGNEKWTLVCEVKSSGQPRNIRMAALQAKDFARRVGPGANVYPVVLAPFISAKTGEICKEMGVGYADLAGNCRLAFGNVYVEKSVAKNPFGIRREQRSLFAPKSGRVLTALLSHPGRAWKLAELAKTTGVSLGQVSNVQKLLLDREWISAQRGALRLIQPDALLDAWRAAYVLPRNARARYYTILHGTDLENALQGAFAVMKLSNALTEAGPWVALSSFSAARWLAPYARVAGEFLYADAEGEKLLVQHLKLEPAARGENVTVDRPRDKGVFLENLEPMPGLRCTGLIQTYLDLAVAGERGAEAADHLRQQKIAPLWKEPT